MTSPIYIKDYAPSVFLFTFQKRTLKCQMLKHEFALKYYTSSFSYQSKNKTKLNTNKHCRAVYLLTGFVEGGGESHSLFKDQE